MSRCFPFPPPGYEKTNRDDEELELLAKEKRKEKKHKKERKDKEKKDGEERNDAESSKEKHKEKKDRKEKHKDKKKDKDKDREKEKNKLTDEKHVEGRTKGYNGIKFGENSHQIEENEDYKYMAELVRRIGDEERCMGKQIVENFASTSQRTIEGTSGSKEETVETSKEKHREKKDGKEKHKDKKKDKDREKDKNRLTDEKRVEDRNQGYNGVKIGERSLQIEENKDAIFKAELVRRIEDEERCMGNQMVENFASTSQRRIEGTCIPKEETKKSLEGKEKIKDKAADEKKTNRHKGKDRYKDRDREEGKSKGKDREKDKENGKEKLKEKKSDHKHKEHSKHRKSSKNDQIDLPLPVEAMFPTKERETTSLFTAKDKKDLLDPPLTIKATLPTKEIEKISSFPSKDKRDQINPPITSKAILPTKEIEKMSSFPTKDRRDQIDPPISIKATFPTEGIEKISPFPKDKKDQIDPPLTIKATFPTKDIEKISLFSAKDTEKIPSVKGNLRKRKDFETNGVLHDNYMQPNKLPRLDYSSHLPRENGRKVETGHRAIPCASERGVADRKKIVEVVENKEHKINGKIEARPLSINSKPPVSLRTVENGGESSKPPHPDSKYLSQILSIPKMEEWSDFDDQEWLFGNDDHRSRPKPGSEVDGGTPQVWEKTLRIESEDIYALPYVLPF